ncbi:hypothetical protein HHI36_018682 [Cryptolaemus montrouzieri]|uniref:Uncharacterized protein n=1 Tax=Cryptolaemus montrouzieri TaxID=559131 RepID=A0ABD2P0U2_9CUCU
MAISIYEADYSYTIASARKLNEKTLASMLKCKTCNSDITFTKSGVNGLGFNINIECGDRKKITIAAKSVAEISLKKSGIEEKKLNQEKGFPEDKLSLSKDDTCSKHGFSSLLCDSTLID